MTDINRKTELHFGPTASECQGMVYDDSGKDIAILYDRTDGYGELFAAAPKLLEACKSLCDVLELQSDELQNATIAYLPEYNHARQAIAKAKKE